MCVCWNWSLLELNFTVYVCVLELKSFKIDFFDTLSIRCATPHINESCYAWPSPHVWVRMNRFINRVSWPSRPTPGGFDGLLWVRDWRIQSLMHATYECVMSHMNACRNWGLLHSRPTPCGMVGIFWFRDWCHAPGGYAQGGVRVGVCVCVCGVCVCVWVCVCECVCVLCVCVSVLVCEYFTDYLRTLLSKRAQAHAA